MKNFVVYANGSAGNHGCEALTRSLGVILGGNVGLTFASLNLQEDERYELDRLFNFVPLTTPIVRDWKYLIYALKQKLAYSDYRYYKLLYNKFLASINPDTIYLSSGGDNYSYNNNVWLECLNDGINDKGGKTILVGCSLLDRILNPQMIKDLSRYSAIVTRESISYNAVMEADVKTPVSCIPDPAFVLPCVHLSLPENFIPYNTVGVNISPMIIGYEKNEGITVKNYTYLIEYILNETNMNVALIPHVVWDWTDDRKPLHYLYELYKHTGRVCFIEDHNAEELKGYIARCRYMVAARTHASIAAYSSQVPTLVVGYSVKARGIARDIFGTENNYVVSVQSLKSESCLLDHFRWLMEKEQTIRNHYATFMPQYIDKCYKLNRFLAEIASDI